MASGEKACNTFVVRHVVRLHSGKNRMLLGDRHIIVGMIANFFWHKSRRARQPRQKQIAAEHQHFPSVEKITNLLFLLVQKLLVDQPGNHQALVWRQIVPRQIVHIDEGKNLDNSGLSDAAPQSSSPNRASKNRFVDPCMPPRSFFPSSNRVIPAQNWSSSRNASISRNVKGCCGFSVTSSGVPVSTICP